jgi:hypothetical protein
MKVIPEIYRAHQIRYLPIYGEIHVTFIHDSQSRLRSLMPEGGVKSLMMYHLVNFLFAIQSSCNLLLRSNICKLWEILVEFVVIPLPLLDWVPLSPFLIEKVLKTYTIKIKSRLLKWYIFQSANILLFVILSPKINLTNPLIIVSLYEIKLWEH